jgi:hypothetical protein
MRLRVTSSAIGITSMALSSHADCEAWAFGTNHRPIVTLAKWLCRTTDRIDPARVRRPYRRVVPENLIRADSRYVRTQFAQPTLDLLRRSISGLGQLRSCSAHRKRGQVDGLARLNQTIFAAAIVTLHRRHVQRGKRPFQCL